MAIVIGCGLGASWRVRIPRVAWSALLRCGSSTALSTSPATNAALARYATALPPRARWHGFAITDYAVPGVRLMHGIVDAIDAELQRGARVIPALPRRRRPHRHGAWLLAGRAGLAGPDALAADRAQARRAGAVGSAPHSPETDAQRAFVLTAGHRAARLMSDDGALRIVFDFGGVLFNWQPDEAGAALSAATRAAAIAAHTRTGGWRCSRASAATGRSSTAACSMSRELARASSRAPASTRARCAALVEWRAAVV